MYVRRNVFKKKEMKLTRMVNKSFNEQKREFKNKKKRKIEIYWKKLFVILSLLKMNSDSMLFFVTVKLR